MSSKTRYIITPKGGFNDIAFILSNLFPPEKEGDIVPIPRNLDNRLQILNNLENQLNESDWGKKIYTETIGWIAQLKKEISNQFVIEIDNEEKEQIDLLNNLSENPEIKIQVDRLCTFDQDSTPYDCESYNFKNWGVKGLKKIHEKFRGQNTKIAIIDSGVSDPNNYLCNLAREGSTIKGFNLIDPYKKKSSLDDRADHGTRVTSVASYMAPDAQIWPIKITNSMSFPESNAILALQLCNKLQMDVVNCSWSVDIKKQKISFSKQIEDFFENMKNKTCFIFSAGKGPNLIPCTDYRGRNNLISTGNITQLDKRYSSSNHGPGVFIYAPGVDITTLNSYGLWDSTKVGTSISAPYVSAVVSLMISRFRAENTSYSIERIRKDIINGSSSTTDNPPIKIINIINTINQKKWRLHLQMKSIIQKMY